MIFQTTRKNRATLLVDDDEGVRSLLQHAMTKLGWQVHAAADGASALSLFQAQIDAIALLITDVQMPVMNGCELAKRIRDLRPTLPIVFMSGDSGLEFQATIETISNCRYLRKPFRTAELVALVPELVN